MSGSSTTERSASPAGDTAGERTIYCCGCGRNVVARLTDGKEIYRHRPDLSVFPFWKCDTCGNYVGCHHKTADRTKPLGCIPTNEIKAARQHIHRILDPLWMGKGKARRKEVYQKIRERLGHEYHTAEIRSVDEARKIYAIVKSIAPTVTTDHLDDTQRR